MFVPCPNCGFLVALAAKRAGTSQHCPRCNALMDEEGSVPPDRNEAAVPSPSAAPAEATAPAAPQPQAAPAPEPEPGPEPEAKAEPAPPAAPATITHPEAATGTARPRVSGPSFTRVRVDPHASAPRWPPLLAVAGLALLLALQLLLSQRAELATQARWRPVLGALCSALFCELPPWHQPGAYAMLDRSVTPRPERPGVLHVNASFRNDARWAQAWPVLVLSLSDVDGRQVGLRAFAPDEYRGNHDADDVLEPGQSTTVSFDVVEPAPHIVAFTFDFQ